MVAFKTLVICFVVVTYFIDLKVSARSTTTVATITRVTTTEPTTTPSTTTVVTTTRFTTTEPTTTPSTTTVPTTTTSATTVTITTPSTTSVPTTTPSTTGVTMTAQTTTTVLTTPSSTAVATPITPSKTVEPVPSMTTPSATTYNTGTITAKFYSTDNHHMSLMTQPTTYTTPNPSPAITTGGVTTVTTTKITKTNTDQDWTTSKAPVITWLSSTPSANTDDSLSSNVVTTTQAQTGTNDQSRSYDRELVIIFGVMLGLMFIVIVIFGINKCRERNKSSNELPLTSSDKFRTGGGDVSIAASSF